MCHAHGKGRQVHVRYQYPHTSKRIGHQFHGQVWHPVCQIWSEEGYHFNSSQPFFFTSAWFLTEVVFSCLKAWSKFTSSSHFGFPIEKDPWSELAWQNKNRYSVIFFSLLYSPSSSTRLNKLRQEPYPRICQAERSRIDSSIIEDRASSFIFLFVSIVLFVRVVLVCDNRGYTAAVSSYW